MFIKNLDYALIGGEEYNPYKRKYKLLRDYKFFMRTDVITIPAGYMWDGPTSVPYVDTLNAAWLEPSLVHDYLYDAQGHADGKTFTRKEVDDNFFISLRSRGVSAIYILIMKYALDRVFQKVWDDTNNDAPTKMRKYMVPFILIGFAIGAAITTGLLIYAPAVLGAIAAL